MTNRVCHVRRPTLSYTERVLSPVSIQTQSLGLHALRKRKPQECKRLRWQAANHGCHYFDQAFLLAGACVCCVKLWKPGFMLHVIAFSQNKVHCRCGTFLTVDNNRETYRLLYLGHVGGELMRLAAGVHSALVFTVIGKPAVETIKRKSSAKQGHAAQVQRTRKSHINDVTFTGSILIALFLLSCCNKQHKHV